MNSPLSSRFLGLLAVGAAALAFPAVALAGTHVDVGVSIGTPLPHGYSRVYVGRDPYYYHRGVFYRPGRHGYYVVHAPRGAIIRSLPPHYSRVYIGSSVFYRYGDVYYRDYPGGYVVVDAPERVVTTTTTSVVPSRREDDRQTIWVGEDEYEFNDGQFFKKTADGLVWAPAPMGAITKSLPADARSVWHEEIEYFECEDVYFRKTPEGYKVVEAPWAAARPKVKG
jgi:hypothetical protein